MSQSHSQGGRDLYQGLGGSDHSQQTSPLPHLYLLWYFGLSSLWSRSQAAKATDVRNRHSMGREKKAGFCFNNGLISTFQLLFFFSSELVSWLFLVCTQFLAAGRERRGNHWRGETHSSFHGRGKELHFTPSHTLLSPSLSLSPQSLVKEPVVPSKETAVTKHRGGSSGRRKWCLFTVFPYVQFYHFCAKSMRISFTHTPTCTWAPGYG